LETVRRLRRFIASTISLQDCPPLLHVDSYIAVPSFDHFASSTFPPAPVVRWAASHLFVQAHLIAHGDRSRGKPQFVLHVVITNQPTHYPLICRDFPSHPFYTSRRFASRDAPPDIRWWQPSLAGWRAQVSSATLKADPTLPMRWLTSVSIQCWDLPGDVQSAVSGHQASSRWPSFRRPGPRG